MQLSLSLYIYELVLGVCEQGIERLLEEALGPRCLDVGGSDRPFLLSEPNRTHQDFREFLCELSFELFQVRCLLCRY